MKRLPINTLFMLMLLFSGTARAGINVMVTASTSGTPNLDSYTADVRFHSTISVTNDLPAYYSAIVTHYLYSATDDCFFTNATDDCFFTNTSNNFSFCCAFYGNYGEVLSTHRNVGCPIDAHCEAFGYAGGSSDYAVSSCLSPCFEQSGGGRSPIIFSIYNQRIELTDLSGGVRFDLDGDGSAEAISWTSSKGSDDAFLVLDRNGNNVVDDGSELFGDASPQPAGEKPNGFRALALFADPANGGNGDGFLSIEDSIFSSLRLWLDSSHDGVSQGSELWTLAEKGIQRIDLSYKESARRDKYGNEFRFRGKATRVDLGTIPIWDVFLLKE